MAQHLKDEIQDGIANAALQVFGRRGYSAATMAEVAELAGISTGNIYRYFGGKRALYRHVVSASLVAEFTRLVRRRVKALEGIDDIGTLAADAPYHVFSEELLQFCIDHRLALVVLLGRAEGTEHEDFAARMEERLVQLALAHARATRPWLQPTATLRFALRQIYRSFVRTMATILASFDDEADIREAVAHFSAYHLAGLRNLFDHRNR